MGGNKAGDKTALSVPSPSLFRNVLPALQTKWPQQPRPPNRCDSNRKKSNKEGSLQGKVGQSGLSRVVGGPAHQSPQAHQGKPLGSSKGLKSPEN